MSCHLKSPQPVVQRRPSVPPLSISSLPARQDWHKAVTPVGTTKVRCSYPGDQANIHQCPTSSLISYHIYNWICAEVLWANQLPVCLRSWEFKVKPKQTRALGLDLDLLIYLPYLPPSLPPSLPTYRSIDLSICIKTLSNDAQQVNQWLWIKRRDTT